MAAARPAHGRPRPALLVVLGLLVLVFAWYYRGLVFGAPEAADAPGAARATIEVPKDVLALRAIPAIPVQRPQLAGGYDPGRNLFDFSESPEVARQRREAAEAAKRAEAAAAAQRERAAKEAQLAEERRRKELEAYIAEHGQPPPPPPQPPPPPPPPPAFGYAYIGNIRRGPGDYLAIIERRGAAQPQPLPVGVGEVVDRQFVIKKIDIDTLVIGFTDPQFKDRTETIRLVPAGPGSRR